MERIVIALYRPKPGKETQLLGLIKEHIPILKSQDLVSDRKPIVMQAKDKTVIEVFGWKSSKAIEEAHSNEVVQKLWNRFSEVCEYEVPIHVDEFQNLFSEFTPIN